MGTGYDAVSAFGELTVRHMFLDGAGIHADIVDRITSAPIVRSIEQASQITLNINDVKREAIASPLLKKGCKLVLDGHSFTLVQVTKSSDQLSLLFEDSDVNALRHVRRARTFGANALSRPHAAAQVARSIPGLRFAGDPNASPIQQPLALGVKLSDGTFEDWWSGLLRWADEVQDRCFISNRTLHFGSDAWLLGQPAIGTVAERAGGIDTIDFDYDEGKPLTSGTITGQATLWAGEPGQPVITKSLGPGSGRWLISEISRDLMRSPVTIQIIGPQASLPEAAKASSTSSSTKAALAEVAGLIVVQGAEKRLNLPYDYGATGPKAYDCSGLTQACYADAGIAIPRTSEAQWAACTQVAQGDEQPGDLAFFTGADGTSNAPGHVGVFTGADMMIDAPHQGAVVRYDPVSSFGNFIGYGRFS